MLRERLIPVVNLAWTIGKTGLLEELRDVLAIRVAIAAVLVKLQDLASGLSLEPDALMVKGCCQRLGVQDGCALSCLAIVTLHETVYEVFPFRAVTCRGVIDTKLVISTFLQRGDRPSLNLHSFNAFLVGIIQDY